MAFYERDWETAAEHLQLALKLIADGKTGEAISGLESAVALDGMGRGNEAVTILRRLLREHPKSDLAADAQVLFDKLTGKGPG